jgi:hypothetical protein
MRYPDVEQKIGVHACPFRGQYCHLTGPAGVGLPHVEILVVRDPDVEQKIRVRACPFRGQYCHLTYRTSWSWSTLCRDLGCVPDVEQKIGVRGWSFRDHEWAGNPSDQNQPDIRTTLSRADSYWFPGNKIRVGLTIEWNSRELRSMGAWSDIAFTLLSGPYRVLLDDHMIRFEACDWTNTLDIIINHSNGFPMLTCQQNPG